MTILGMGQPEGRLEKWLVEAVQNLEMRILTGMNARGRRQTPHHSHPQEAVRKWPPAQQLGRKGIGTAASTQRICFAEDPCAA
mmetsp:Transcript_91982/g.269039  ORF Transcript_91982/g.269039 Transcript_91982/m.269039 type:complete len:83 (-) Transcript_91982:313-561(-)